MLQWNVGEWSGSALMAYLDVPDVAVAIAKLEAAAGVKGDWDWDPDLGSRWWGLHGTFKGAVFTVYESKGGALHIGGHNGLFKDEALDTDGLTAALLAVVTS